MRRKTLFVLSFDVAAKLLGALATLLVIRLLPASEYAAYTLALAIVAVITQTMASGINRIYILAYDRLELKEGRGAVFGVQLVVGVIASLALYPLFDVSKALGIAMVAMAVALIASDFVKTECQRQLAFTRFSYVELFRNLVFLLCLGGMIAAGRELWSAETVTALQAAAIGAIGIPLLFRLDLLHGMAHLRRGVAVATALIGENHRYLFGYFLVLAVLSQLDVFMLKSLADQQNLAAFGSAFRYYSLLVMALGAVHAVLLPMIAKVETKRELGEIYRKHGSLVWIFALGVLFSVILAPWWIPVIDGGRYPEAVTVFQVLALSSVISFAYSPHVNLVMRFERYRFLFVLVSLATAVKFLLNGLLIPRYGAFGAALTTLVAYGVINVAIYFWSRRLLAHSGEMLPAR